MYKPLIRWEWGLGGSLRSMLDFWRKWSSVHPLSLGRYTHCAVKGGSAEPVEAEPVEFGDMSEDKTIGDAGRLASGGAISGQVP